MSRSTNPDEFELDLPGGEPELVNIKLSKMDQPQSRWVDKVLAFSVTFLPIGAAILAVYLHLIGWYSIGIGEIAVMVLMHALALIGVELGYHRLFAHRSYTATRAVKIVFAALGSLAFQGPVIWWTAVHRRHHRYSDRPNDPHSLYISSDGSEKYNKGFWQLAMGFIHSHVGWVWTPASIRPPGWNRYVRDMYKDKDLWFIHVNYVYILALGFIIPGVILGLATMSFKGFFLGVLWGGFVRVFVMNHLSYWTINNLSHSVGKRPYKTADFSTNSIPWLFAVPTLGQSYHNNHHAFPTSAFMAHERYELDLGGYILRAMQRLAWVSELRRPSDAQRQRKKIDPSN